MLSRFGISNGNLGWENFLKVDMPRETKNGKTSVIDVLCEDPDGNTFIVEIQKIKQMTFRERMVADSLCISTRHFQVIENGEQQVAPCLAVMQF